MFDRETEHLKARLEERLRTALEFATLGAYGPAAPARPPAKREVPQRVFLFAKVSPPCPHGADSARDCGAAGADHGEYAGIAGARSAVAARARVRRARRGGGAKPAPQPCTWAGDRG